MSDDLFYDDALRAEAFGIIDSPLRRGAPPGNGMAIIAELVEKLPPMPFNLVNDVLGRSMK